VMKSGFKVNLVFEHTQNLRDRLVRSAMEPQRCSVESRRAADLQAKKRRRGRPLAACICCLSGMRDTMCDSSGVVYSFYCVFCSKEYIGETFRCVRDRFSDHHVQARLKIAGTPLGMHMILMHSSLHIKPGQVIFKQAQVLAIESRDSRRKIREAIEIRERKPEINLNNGWVLA